jgi:hypothetical protein
MTGMYYSFARLLKAAYSFAYLPSASAAGIERPAPRDCPLYLENRSEVAACETCDNPILL